MKKIDKKNIMFFIMDIIVLIIVIGISYASFSYVKKGQEPNRIVAGAITMSYTESSNKISIANATPMSDASGEVMNGVGEYFDFTVSTNMTVSSPITYEVTAEKDNESTLANDEVRLYLEKKTTQNGEYVAVFSPKEYTPINSEYLASQDELGALNSEMLLDTGEVSTNQTIYYRLRMWIAEGYTHTQNSNSFQVTVNVYGKDVTVEGANGITLDKSTLNMQVGTTNSITATVTPSSAKNKNLIWESVNPSVVKVDSNGNLTAVAIGTSRIIVKTSDQRFSAECVVTVVNSDATGISLNYNNLQIIKGNTSKLTATVTPSNATNKTVTWISSDTGIATVSSDGTITARRAGSVVITASTNNGYTATCNVSIREADVSGITLNTSSLSVTKGSTGQLTATITPDNLETTNIIWTSSNETIATVNKNGKVSGLSAGTATITATVKEYPDYTASATVTVSLPNISSITMSSDMSVFEEQSSVFAITLTPEEVGNKSSIVWESSNTSVATIPAGCAGHTYCEIEGLSAGTTTITAKTTSLILDTATLTVSELTAESIPKHNLYSVLVKKGTILESTNQDEYPVYYYSGAEDSNNVKFGGYCWKMIRTTQTGGVKMIYNGTPDALGHCITTTGTDTQIGTSAYNATYNSTAYNSTAKTTVDNWYNSNLKNDYEDYLETTTFCGNTLSSSNYLGTCSPSYNLKVGLISADEAYLAGLNKTDSNTTNYLYTGQSYWTMSAGSGSSSQGISFTRSGSNYKVGTYSGTGTSSNMLALNSSGTLVDNNNGTYYGNGNLSSCSCSGGGSIYNICCTLSTSSYGSGGCTCSGNYSGGGLASSYGSSASGSSLGVRPVVSISSSPLLKSGNGSQNAPYVLDELSS